MADGLERPPPEERKRDPGQGNRALENGTQNTASYQAAESERQAAILIGSDAAVYEAYPIKRHRSTKREVWQRRLHLYGIVHKMRPMTVRQVFYQATVHEIVEKTGGTKHLALIGIRRRGVPIAQRIAQAMRGIDGVEVPVGILDITLYRDDLSKVAPQAVLQSSDIPFGVDDMDLVLMDDVLYTGRTIRAAMNGLFDLGRPRRIRLCVLIDRGHREMPIEAQFIGRTVQTSDTEIIEVRLHEVDSEERVMLVDRVAGK